MISHVLPRTLKMIEIGDLHLDTDDLKVMLLSPDFILHATDLLVDDGTTGCAARYELVSTGYHRGWNGGGRRNVKLTKLNNIGTDQYAVPTVLWSSLGTVDQKADVGFLAVIREGPASDYESLLVSLRPLSSFPGTHRKFEGGPLVLNTAWGIEVSTGPSQKSFQDMKDAMEKSADEEIGTWRTRPKLFW